MKTRTETLQRTYFQSERFPGLFYLDPGDAALLEFVDQNPLAYEIVTTQKSKAWGLGSCVYIGWAQKSMDTSAIRERLREFHENLQRPETEDHLWAMQGYSARFTLAHFKDKGFTGGFFRQWDEKHSRLCKTLDYTPELLEEVLDKFSAWAGGQKTTRRYTLDEKTVREIPP